MNEIISGAGSGSVFGPHVRGWNVDGGDVTAIEDIDLYPYSDELMYGDRISGGRFEAGGQ